MNTQFIINPFGAVTGGFGILFLALGIWQLACYFKKDSELWMPIVLSMFGITGVVIGGLYLFDNLEYRMLWWIILPAVSIVLNLTVYFKMRYRLST